MKRTYVGLVGLIALHAMIGCSDAESPPRAELGGHPVVTRLDDATPTECPGGGLVARAGVDRNDSGSLDDEEVTGQAVRCSYSGEAPPPAPFPQVLVRIVPGAAGANCPEGGDNVGAGLDRNGNGQLDDEEVLQVDYVCGRG